jgi:hypothetical protein
MLFRLTPLAWCTCLLATAASAQAAPTFELVGRSSAMSMQNLQAAFGTALAELEGGTLGSSAISPSLLQVSGGGYKFDEDFLYTVDITAEWALWQDHSTAQVGADAVLSGSGALALTSSSSFCNAGICDAGTATYQSTNFQRFVFSLSEATAYQAQGLSSREQSVNIEYSADGGQSWTTYLGWNSFMTYGGSILIGPQEVTAWSQAGTFAAGLYKVSNGPNGYGTPSPYSWFSWDYGITLLGTTVAAPVPEPGGLLLMAAGLGVVLLRRHRPAA